MYMGQVEVVSTSLAILQCGQLSIENLTVMVEDLRQNASPSVMQTQLSKNSSEQLEYLRTVMKDLGQNLSVSVKDLLPFLTVWVFGVLLAFLITSLFVIICTITILAWDAIHHIAEIP